MKNKLNKEYLLELYETGNEDNMVYALTLLRSLGLKDWFKKVFEWYEYSDFKFFSANTKFIDMYDLDKLSANQIRITITNCYPLVKYFKKKHFEKLKKYYNIINNITP